MKAICKTTGAIINLDNYGENCNRSGQIKVVWGVIEPMLYALKNAKNMDEVSSISKVAQDRCNLILTPSKQEKTQ